MSKKSISQTARLQVEDLAVVMAYLQDYREVSLSGAVSHCVTYFADTIRKSGKDKKFHNAGAAAAYINSFKANVPIANIPDPAIISGVDEHETTNTVLEAVKKLKEQKQTAG